jgi:hypothetical protein
MYAKQIEVNLIPNRFSPATAMLNILLEVIAVKWKHTHIKLAGQSHTPLTGDGAICVQTNALSIVLV